MPTALHHGHGAVQPDEGVAAPPNAHRE
jgi:hypothetical protein